jgi:hypothetical protein
MNYHYHYTLLIEKAKQRLLEGYVEKHHILPKCLGGTDDLSNLVALTPEEHFLAHQLLIKIYPNEPKLLFAAHMMTVNNGKNNRSNKMYGWLRRKYNEVRKDIKRKPRKKETKPRKPRVYTEEWRRKIGDAARGRVLSEEQKKKISESNKRTKSLRRII